LIVLRFWMYSDHRDNGREDRHGKQDGPASTRNPAADYADKPCEE